VSAALITPPAIEPVTLAEAKAHLRLSAEGGPEDDLIAALLVAARIHVERATRLMLIAQTWRLYRDDWPEGGVLTLRLNPVIGIGAITVYDRDGAPQELPATAYRLDAAARPARIALLGAAGPLTPGAPLNGVEIDVTAGYGASGIDVPQPLRLAIMMLATRWYEGRDGFFTDAVPGDVADAFEALIAPFRVVRL
jgi:uncharacterized phiE125 gp8 family phage protein